MKVKWSIAVLVAVLVVGGGCFLAGGPLPAQAAPQGGRLPGHGTLVERKDGLLFLLEDPSFVNQAGKWWVRGAAAATTAEPDLHTGGTVTIPIEELRSLTHVNTKKQFAALTAKVKKNASPRP